MASPLGNGGGGRDRQEEGASSHLPPTEHKSGPKTLLLNPVVLEVRIPSFSTACLEVSCNSGRGKGERRAAQGAGEKDAQLGPD